MPASEPVPTVAVRGAAVDEQTRCVHWHSELDVVALQFACCGEFYPCRTCHDEAADHPTLLWPVTSRAERAVLCGVCRHRLRIADYLASGDACPACGAAFNPGCRLHHNLYFDQPRDAKASTSRSRPRPTWR